MKKSIQAVYEIYQSGSLVGWLLGETHKTPTKEDKEKIDKLLPQADVLIVESWGKGEIDFLAIDESNPFYTEQKSKIDPLIDETRPFLEKKFGVELAEKLLSYNPLVISDYIIGKTVSVETDEEVEEYFESMKEYKDPGTYSTSLASENGTVIIGAYSFNEHMRILWNPKMIKTAYKGIKAIFNGDIEKEEIIHRFNKRKNKRRKISRDKERDNIFADKFYIKVKEKKRPLAIYGVRHVKGVLTNLKKCSLKYTKIG